MKSLILVTMLVLLSGCSFSTNTLKQDGHQYEYHVKSCVRMPDIANKVQEGLGQSKVCLRAGVGVVIVPSDYPEDRL